MRNNTTRALAVVAALSMIATACGNGDDAADSEPDDPDTTDVETDDDGDDDGDDGDDESAADGDLSFIYITPNPIGVNQFLELGQIGTEAAAADLGGTARTFESTDLNSRRANIEAAVDDAPDVIVLTTFEFTELAEEFATANPDQDFILIDACPENVPDNLHCGVFREYESAYLIGVMAGALSDAGEIGSVVALDIPFLRRFSDGFRMGAESVNDAVTDRQVFIGGDNPFSDPARAKEQALALAAQGVDHMLAAGSGSNGGVFEAAEEEGFFAYGVDVNQCPDAPGVVVDNVLKRVDVVAESLIRGVLDGTAENVNSFGLAEEGVGVVALLDDVDDSSCVIAEHPDVIEQVREAHDAIVDGSLELADPMLAG
ncbi:MAG: BMP family ABC transporter substrate-binding protein [Nitriliruptoraceae bacterium]|nr:BMP family ABC transporter substrate-binding protein [Nitriliruptoraceae bacterium]